MSGVIVQCGHWAPVSADELQVIAPGAARRYAPPADGSSTRGGSTSVRGRSAVRTSLVAAAVAKLQAASVPIA